MARHSEGKTKKTEGAKRASSLKAPFNKLTGKADNSGSDYNKERKQQMKEAGVRGDGYQGKKFLVKQRRLEKKGKWPAEGGDARAAASSSTGKGFQIGPKPRKGVYTGKADKIKAGLIRNAKIKQSYAKVLKQEGRNRPNDQGDELQEDGPNITDEELEADSEPEASTSALSPMKTDFKAAPAKRPRRDPSRMQEDAQPPSRPQLKKRKSSELERNPDDMLDDEDAAPAPGPDAPASGATIDRGPFVHPSRRAGGKGREQAQVEQEPKPKRPRLSESEIDELRQKRENDKKAWAKKGKRGQPNMGSRMGVLLGKIERKVGL